MLDDPSNEEHQEFRLRLGRWRQDAMSAILSPVWWLALNIVARMHEPLTHHFAFVRTSNVCNMLSHMTCGKAKEISLEISGLMASNSHTWAKLIVLTLFGCEGALPDGLELADLLELGVALNCHHHASYQRRIIRDTQRLPLALFWIAFERPEVQCPMRKSVAQFILHCKDEYLEANARKLRVFAFEEFEEMAASGRCGPILFSIMSCVAATAKGDVAINEGHNSLIKSIVQRCRNIGLPLLSARSNCKKELRVGIRGAPSKWSQVKKQALCMVQDTDKLIFNC